MSWPMIPLGDLCSPKQWPTLSKAQMSASGHVVYGANGPIGFSETVTHHVRSILIGCRGSCGSVHVIPAMSYANGNAMALDELNEKKVDLDFLALFLRARGFRDVVTGSSQPQIIRSNIVRIKIPLPPLDEQRRIAAILDKADALRRQRKRALDLLDGLTQSVFQQLFSDSAATEMTLADLVDPCDRINYGVIQPGEPAVNGVPLVRAGDLRGGRVDRSNLRTISSSVSDQYSRSLLKGGEILIGCVGSIGAIAVATQDDIGSNIARAVARIPLAKDVSRVYIAEYLRTARVQDYFKAELRTVTQPTLNIKQITETRIMMPSKFQIAIFESVVDKIARNVANFTVSMQALEKVSASLQHRAFSGQL